MLGGVAHAIPPQFGQTYLRLDRMEELLPTGGTVCAEPATALTEADVQVTFPTQSTGTDFVVDSTAANWTTTVTNLPAGATAWPGLGGGIAATAVSGKTVTFPSTDLTVGTLYCFNFDGTSTLTNGSNGHSLTGVIHTRDGSAAVIDETNYAVAITTNDQITVSAIVPPTFVFALNGSTDTFTGNLDPTLVKSSGGRTATVTTNAKGGWIAWVKDSQQGLHSAAAAYTIATAGTIDGAPSTLTAGTEGFVLDTDLTTDALGGCTVNIDPEYDGVGVASGGTLSANFQPIASCTGAHPATSNGDVLTLIERVAIAGGTPAGSDYSDILTVVAAGNF